MACVYEIRLKSLKYLRKYNKLGNKLYNVQWLLICDCNENVWCSLPVCHSALEICKQKLLNWCTCASFSGVWASRRVDVFSLSSRDPPVLRRLHWLPVRRRIEFKLALLRHKSLHRSTPRYLSDDCQLVSDVGRRPIVPCATPYRAPQWA